MNKIENIYKTHVDDLFSYGVHLGFDESLIKDCIQNVFVKLLKNKKLKIDNTKAYLYRSVRNELVTEYKKTNKNLPIDNINEVPFDIEISVEDLILEKESANTLKHKIESALKELSPRQREIIYFRYTQDYSYELIAEIMQLSVPSSRNLVLKALNKLRKQGLNYSIFLFII